jgi:FkbM family methyltransferase
MHSYAQNFEDVTLRRALLDIDHGFYVDLGSYHPSIHSVTKHFYDRGWSGVNVEPNPALLAQFIADRPRDINLGVAVGSENAEIALYIIGDTGLTTTIQSLACRHGSTGHATTDIVRVKSITLDALFETYCGDRTIDFLKIDVECAESAVILPCSFESRRPRIIVLENSEGYHDHLLSRGYVFCWFDGLNRWYVRKEDDLRCSYLARPPSLWDSISNFQQPE